LQSGCVSPMSPLKVSKALGTFHELERDRKKKEDEIELMKRPLISLKGMKSVTTNHKRNDKDIATTG